MVRSRTGAGIAGVVGILRSVAVRWRLEQLERRLQLFTGRSQILQQLHFTVKVNEEGFVLFLDKHLIEKTAARVSLRVEDVGLAAAGVDKQTQREWEIRFLRKIADSLRTAVFLKREIVFGEVADNLAMFVANGDGQRDYFDVDGDGGSGLLSPDRRADSRKSDQCGDQRTGNRHPQGFAL